MITQPTPAMVDERPLVGIALHVFKEGIVEPPGVVQRRYILVEDPLLPIEPPEVDPLLFDGVQHDIEKGLHEFFVSTLPRDIFPRGGIEIHLFGKIVILALKGSDTRSGVQIQRSLQMFRLGPVEKLIGVGEKSFFPRVAGLVLELVPGIGFGKEAVGLVPVHIDHQHIERYVVLLEPRHDIAHLVVGVGPVARPPVAEYKTGRQGHLPGKEGKIFQGRLIVGPIGHEIPILNRPVFIPLFDPGKIAVVKQEALRIVDQRPAVAREYTVFQLQLMPGLVALNKCRAVHTVERAGRALQIALLLHTGIPSEGIILILIFYTQIFCRKFSGIQPIGQLQLIGTNNQFPSLYLFLKVGHRQMTVHHHE